MTKLSPFAYGVEFGVTPTGRALDINVSAEWACYYRIYPTLTQQLERQTVQREANEHTSSVEPSPTGVASPNDLDSHEDAPVASLENEDADPNEAPDDEPAESNSESRPDEVEDSPEVDQSAHDRRESRATSDPMFIRFRKITCRAAEVISLTPRGDGWAANDAAIQAALDDELRRAAQVAAGDPERLRTAGGPEDEVRVPQNALVDEDSYRRFLNTLTTEVDPLWGLDASSDVSLRPSGSLSLLVQLVNTSPVPPRLTNVEPFLFDTEATFSVVGGDLIPFELDLGAKGFRFDRDLWGRGFNCAAEADVATRTLRTTHNPIHHQGRYQTQSTPEATFAELARDPLPVLARILTAMEAYRHEWDRQWERYQADGRGAVAGAEIEYQRDRATFEGEIERFRQGLEILRQNVDVRTAFQLTNETFRRVGDDFDAQRRKEAWRLFQIVFVVTQIPGMASLAGANATDNDELRNVDIIYFPTGGGKTEAYLATIALYCFFDRLRGKSAGVTAWTRFPLRLLTLQQTQRVADVIGMADLVRREQSDARLHSTGVDGFAVGYFVGKEATPNDIVDPNRYQWASPADQATWSKANDPVARQDWKRVTKCPSCKTRRVVVDFDPARARLLHKCSEPGCRFTDGVIPVYVTDNEVYRYLPAVLVGTIDKLASLGNQRKLAQVFGQVDGRCREHGYYKAKCCQKDCSHRRDWNRVVPPGLSGPTLFVQDELHLLREGLGTFDSHYETFVQRLREDFGQSAPLKILASSATIEAFGRQVLHLYGRPESHARRFPGPSPSLMESFYARTLQNPQRLYVGIIPHNKTIFNAVLELIESYHGQVEALRRLPSGSPSPFGGAIVPGTPEWATMLDAYISSVSYFLANPLLNSIRTDLESHVNPRLHEQGFPQLDIFELTGGTSTDHVTRILDHLEQPALGSPTANCILATNMISHGVDIDRLNAMFFYGMPRQTAEYIQASSRVGRSHVGLVFTVLHPARERDQSHYSYFNKYHEFLGQLVEPVAINRWSRFSIRRTLPGLFMAVLLQKIANAAAPNDAGRFYFRDFVAQRVTSGAISAADFVPLLEDAYLVRNPIGVAEESFHQEINSLVPRFLHDQIVGAGAGRRSVSESLIPSPMTSLRDVDELIPIELDWEGAQWAFNR